MYPRSEREALIALNFIAVRHLSQILRLMRGFKSAVALLGAGKELLKEHGATANFISDLSLLGRFDSGAEINLAGKNGVRIITLCDDDYPDLLKEIYDPPLAIYLKGNLDCDRGIGVVGSRRASFYGISCALRFGRELAAAGITVVSGLARGVDTGAHKGAIESGGLTIAVLGSGIDRIYPAENEKLVSDIVGSNGGIISEYPMGSAPLAHNFPRRNRIISGLSYGVFVVEAALNSGALITADCALDQGREVFALPGKVDSENSSGTNELIRQGAKIVLTVEDILEELPFASRGKRETEGKVGSSFSGCSCEEDRLLGLFGSQPQSIEELMAKSRIPLPRLNALLSGLEVKKVVRRLPGQQFISLRG